MSDLPSTPAGDDQAFLPSASWSVLIRRARLLRQLRHFFDARGFLEVETPLLSHDTVVDRHLDPLILSDPVRPEAGDWYLQTSPEFAMKRLLASAVADPSAPLALYQITRAFRQGELGGLHNPEFTMLEWYEVELGYAAAIEFLAELASEVIGCPRIARISYGEAFQAAVGLDPHHAPPEKLRQAARAMLGDASPTLDPQDRDGWLHLLMAECVEPSFNRPDPVIVYDFPATQAALARVEMQDGVPVARRFELFYRGLELANGYDELLDAEALWERNLLVNRQRQADGKPELPAHSRLLDAMRAGLPRCCGVALGVDRLLMTLCDAPSLPEVLAFPYDRA